MSKLTKAHITILDALSGKDGPIPIDQLSGLPAAGPALSSHLEHLSSRGFVTRTGKAIALTEVGKAALTDAPPTIADQKTPKPAAKEPGAPPTKKSRLVALLKSDTGATVPDLATALDWLPHTTRAALTGVKKSGYEIDKLPPLEGSRSSRYKLVEAA